MIVFKIFFIDKKCYIVSIYNLILHIPIILKLYKVLSCKNSCKFSLTSLYTISTQIVMHLCVNIKLKIHYQIKIVKGGYFAILFSCRIDPLIFLHFFGYPSEWFVALAHACNIVVCVRLIGQHSSNERPDGWFPRTFNKISQL